MTDEHANEVRKQMKAYIGVFLALIVLTGVTVAARSLAVSVAVSIVIALIIATVKGSLVGAFFMHLAWEKKAIYAVLLLAGAFLLFMMGIFAWSLDAHLEGTTRAPIEAAGADHPAPEGH